MTETETPRDRLEILTLWLDAFVLVVIFCVAVHRVSSGVPLHLHPSLYQIFWTGMPILDLVRRSVDRWSNGNR